MSHDVVAVPSTAVPSRLYTSFATEANLPDEHHGNGFYFLKGWAPNPWESYPRNAPCFCGSMKKFKKCHFGNISPAIEESKLQQIKAYRKALNVD